MGVKALDPAGRVLERPPVGGQDQRRLERQQPVQRLQELAQGVGRALGMEGDVGADVGKDLVAGEEQPVLEVEEADVAGRVAGGPLDPQPPAAQLDRLGPVQLHIRLAGPDELAHRAGGVLEAGRVGLRHPVQAQVPADLGDQLLELQVAGMDHRDLEPVHEQLGAGLLLERAGGAEVVGVDVGDDEPPEGGVAAADLPDRRQHGGHRLVGLDAAIEEVDLGSVGEEEAVDDLLLPGDRQADLVDARGYPVELGFSRFGSTHYRPKSTRSYYGRRPMTRGAMSSKLGGIQLMAQEMSADQVTPDVVIEQMPQHLDSAKAGTTNATVQFDLSGDNGGKWWIKIHDGTAEAGKGEVENPNLTLLAAADDYVKIALGQMDGTAAFMQGKLKIKGDMGLAIKFQSLFKRPS